MIKNKKLAEWVQEVAAMCRPDHIHWCNGSEEEYQLMMRLMVQAGTAMWMDASKRPNSIYVRSHPADVARVEDRTYICSKRKEDAGPTNNWADPAEMKAKLSALYDGAIRGRTLYVIPYSMGPVGSRIANIGVELTDSPYVVANMHIMTRMGTKVLDVLGETGEFVKGIHSVGAALDETGPDSPWPCNSVDKYHLPFPRNAGDLVFRLGVWRKRPPGKEMPFSSNCLRPGPRRRVDGGTYADIETYQPGRRSQVHHRSISFCLR